MKQLLINSSESLQHYIKITTVFLAAFVVIHHSAMAQMEITGEVLSPYKNGPVAGAVISASTSEETIFAETDENGKFTLSLTENVDQILINGDGYYEQEIQVRGRKFIRVALVPLDKVNYNEQSKEITSRFSNAQTVTKKNFKKGALYIEDVLQAAFPGLYVVNKGGMPGEGSAIYHRGVRSFQGQNFPLIVINGVPLVPDLNNSLTVSGYVRSALSGINVQNVESITLLRGADAAVFGGMGSNGVLLIETAKATDLETQLSLRSQFGIARNPQTMPLLGVEDFKAYVGDLGLSKYEDANEMLTEFPFLQDDPDYFYNYLYNNDTDWQSEIYEPTMISSNTLSVKGGDAIAKYDLAVGYLSQGGTVKNTFFDRYNARLNANINLGKRTEFVTSVGYGYFKGQHHNQGLLEASNPILAAFYKAPILNPYRKDENNNQLPDYDIYRQFGVSNPLAVVNTVTIDTEGNEIIGNAGLNYQLTDNWRISTLLGGYYGYTRQQGFIPGKSSLAIVPTEDGVALNAVSVNVSENVNMYYQLKADYVGSLAGKPFTAGLGYRGLLTRREVDAGKGINTSSDFYKTLTYVDFGSASFYGYIDNWSWMSLYGYAHMNVSSAITASVTASVDGSSATGIDATRFVVSPGVNLSWDLKKESFLSTSSLVNRFNFNAGYALLSNAQFSSKLGKTYYESQTYREIGGIVSNNVANTNLATEKNQTFDLGFNLAMMSHKLQLNANVFQTISSDLIIPQDISSIYGVAAVNQNAGEITTQGVELSLQYEVLQTKDYGLTLGANVTSYTSEVTDLGNTEAIYTTLPDGAVLVTKKGETPYAFYGYRSNGVFTTQDAATAANLSNFNGETFAAGDIWFADTDENKIINNADREILGDATPDFFGGAFASARFKQFSLTAYFQYAVGGDIYNATRRKTEAMSEFYNQSEAVIRRWQTDGQQTDIPKATYGDPLGNSRFSSRWIEDGSYLRLTHLVLNYHLKDKNSGVVRGGDIFFSGENLFTATNYLGLDPVMAYSYHPALMGVDYAKVANPQVYKIGFNILF